LFKLEFIVDALRLLKPLGHLGLLSFLGAIAKQKLQPLGLQQITLFFIHNLHFNRQNLLASCHNNLLVSTHFLGGLLVLFVG
jgi:hypothetical protein